MKRGFLGQWLALGGVLLALGGVLAFDLHEERQAVEAQAVAQLSLGAKSIALTTERRLMAINSALLELRTNLPYLRAQKNGDTLVTKALETFQRTVSGTRTAMIYDAHGSVTASSRSELVGMNFGQREYFQRVLKQPDPETLYVTPPFVTELGTFTLNLVRATFDARGEFSGIVSVALEPEYFKPPFAALQYTPDVAVGLIHGSGKVLLYLSSPAVPQGTDVSDPSSFFSRHIRSGKESGVFSGTAPVLPGERLAATYTINPVTLSMSAPLVVVVSQELSSILEPWRNDVRNQSALFILLVLVASLSLFFHQYRQIRINRLMLLQQRKQQGVVDRLRHSEERFRAFFDHAMVGMATTSLEKGWMQVNPALCAMLGLTQENLLRKTWVDLTHPEDLAADLALFERLLRDETDQYCMEKRFIRSDGTILTSFIAISAVRHPDRSINFIAAIIEDISERKLGEQKLASALHLTQQFLDNLPGTAYVKDENLRVLMANKTFQDMLGMDPETLLGRSNTELFPGDFGRKLDADDRRVLELGHSTVIDESYDGRFFESIKFVIQGDQGEKLLGGITLDITQRQRLIERQNAMLRISELGGMLPEKEFLGQGLEMIERLTLSQIGFVHFVNESQESIELVTWTPGALKGCTAAYESHYPLAAAGIWADCARHKTIAIFNDYPAYRAKKGLPQGHAPLQRLLTVPIVEEGKVRMILGVGNKVTDYDDVDGETTLVLGNDLWRIVRRVRVEASLHQRLDELNALNVRLDEINNKLLQSEKLASLGQLAAGVAHEINNPIGYVSSNLNSLSGYVNDLLAIGAAYEAVEKSLSSSMPLAFQQVNQLKKESDYSFIVSDIRHLLDESREGLERVRKIVQDLKDFSRVGSAGWQRANLHQGLESTLNIVWNEIKYKAEVDRQYGDLPEVYCIPSQINQVFMNLLTNAAQAIEVRGHIVLRSGREEHTVWFEVEDDGGGISPENLTHIFEPFYTTKPVGQGTGLGLSLSWGIIQRHHGKVEVRSTYGQGTCFRITLPIDQSPGIESTVESIP